MGTIGSGNVVEDHLRHEILALIEALEDPETQRTIALPSEGAEVFLAAVANVLAALPVSSGSRRLVAMLSRDRRFVRVLIDPCWCRATDAEAVSRSTSPAFEEELERELTSLVDAGLQDDDRVLRLLALFEAAGAERHCIWYQGELLSNRNQQIRSKAAKLLARGCRRVAIAERLLHDPDPRVQASFVESLWTMGDVNGAVRLLLEASGSPHHRVVGNAAVGLHHLDRTEAIGLIRRMARHADIRFRTAAVWAMGETGDVRFLRDLGELASEERQSPRLGILRAMARIRSRQRDAAAAGDLEVRVLDEIVLAGGERCLRFALTPGNRAPLHALDLVVTQGDREIDHFSLGTSSAPVAVAAGFVVPPLSTPFGREIEATLQRSQRFKRKGDTWQTAYYRNEDHVVIAAADRLATVVSGVAGSRHVFVVVDGPQNEPTPKLVEHLRSRLSKERITLHVFVPPDAEVKALREALGRMPGCSVTEADMASLPGRLENECATLASVYELRYESSEPVGAGKIAVAGACGCGAAAF